MRTGANDPPHLSQVAANDQNLIDVINEYRASQEQDPITVKFRAHSSHGSLTEAIEIVKEGGGEIEWGDDIESHHCDLIAAKYPGFHFLPRWPMSMKPFTFSMMNEKGSTGGQLSRGFDLNYGRNEMTSGGQREHRVEVLEQNLRDMIWTPLISHSIPMDSATAPPIMRVGDLEGPTSDGVDGCRQRARVVLFPRDRSRVTPKYNNRLRVKTKNMVGNKLSLLLVITAVMASLSGCTQSLGGCGVGYEEMYGGYDYEFSNHDIANDNSLNVTVRLQNGGGGWIRRQR